MTPVHKPEPSGIKIVFILSSVLIGFLGVLGLLTWGIARLSRHYEAEQLRFGDRMFRVFEAKGQDFEVWMSLGIFLAVIVAGLGYALFKYKAFRKSREKPLFWLWITFGYLAFVVLSQFFSMFMGHKLYGSYIEKHHIYYDVQLRSIFAIGLILVGILLYQFKKASKFFYGLSEIALAVISNLALIERADITHVSTFTVRTPDLVAFAAFTYILSRGISNTVEGVQERIDARSRLDGSTIIPPLDEQTDLSPPLSTEGKTERSA